MKLKYQMIVGFDREAFQKAALVMKREGPLPIARRGHDVPSNVVRSSAMTMEEIKEEIREEWERKPKEVERFVLCTTCGHNISPTNFEVHRRYCNGPLTLTTTPPTPRKHPTHILCGKCKKRILIPKMESHLKRCKGSA